MGSTQKVDRRSYPKSDQPDALERLLAPLKRLIAIPAQSAPLKDVFGEERFRPEMLAWLAGAPVDEP